MQTADSIIEQALAGARAHGVAVRSGAQAVELRYSPALRSLAACYRRALKDERTKIPTYLHAALEHVIALSKAEV